jgi:tetratricopeptide (TPR) repeat protein
MKLHLPHISRIFSAQLFSRVGNLCLWILLGALVGFNIFLWMTKPLAYSDKVFQVFTHPFAAAAHKALAQTLWDSGVRPLADQEFALAAEMSPVLGASITAQAAREEAETVYWQNIVTTHSDYRDAYIQLAALLYRQGNLMQAHAYLTQALALDPNNATVNRLADFTSKLLE